MLALVLFETWCQDAAHSGDQPDFGHTLQAVADGAKKAAIPLHKAPERDTHVLMMPAASMLQHWQHSEHALHPISINPVVEP